MLNFQKLKVIIIGLIFKNQNLKLLWKQSPKLSQTFALSSQNKITLPWTEQLKLTDSNIF